MLKKILIAIASLLLIGGLGYVAYNAYTTKMKETNNAPLVFSDNRMLLELWSTYKKTTLEQTSSRTLDKSLDNITTSEGQSYTMLRSVWMDDMETFDKSWQWTKDNAQREDHLISWRYGKLANGTYGIQTDRGGQNTASDADVDIALSLLMASGRWKDPKYKWDALPIIKSIWEKEVIMVNGKPVLAANDIEQNNLESIIVNPSYFSPYAYRVFAKADPSHDWKGLVDSSYDILMNSAKEGIDKPASSGLTPDWIRINRASGAITAAGADLTTNYGYDAMRTPWRMAMDWNWNKEPRAKQVLQTLAMLSHEWQKNHKLAAIYSHDGQVVQSYEAPAMYGTFQAYFDVLEPNLADNYYTRQLINYYNPDTQSWKKQLSYYDDNWVWFGMAMHNGKLVNLTELINE